jgi:hypothetical protein
MTTRKGGGWLSIFGGGRERDSAHPSLPAPIAGGGFVNLPPPVTAREVKQLARQAAALAADRRLVFAIDATASREPAWEALSKPLHDKLLAALPDGLEVALAIHGGGRLQTFSRFTSNPAELRDIAASVRCQSGETRLLDILDRAAGEKGVSCVCYVGDAFEEDAKRARRIADALRLNGTRVIILHDGPPPDAFGMIAERTGGALLPFDSSALDALGELLQAVAVLAVGDVELLIAQQERMPAATLLLEHLKGGGR